MIQAIFASICIFVSTVLVGQFFACLGLSIGGSKPRNLFVTSFTGFLWELVIFEVVFLPLCIVDASYKALKYTYLILIASICILGAVKYGKALAASLLEVPKRFIGAVLVKRSFAMWTLIIATIVIAAGIVFQNAILMHYDGDDAYFMMIGHYSAINNNIFRTHPYFNIYFNLTDSSHYFINGWYMLIGLWVDLLGMHPTVFTQQVMPIAMTIVAIMAIGLLAARLFEDAMARWIFVLMYLVMNVFGYVSNYSQAAFLAFRIQQGKAMFANVCMPILVLVFLEIYDVCADKIGDRRPWIMLGMINIISCMMTTTGLVIGAALTAAYGVVLAVRFKSVKALAGTVLALVPSIIMGLLFVVEVRYGIWH